MDTNKHWSDAQLVLATLRSKAVVENEQDAIYAIAYALAKAYEMGQASLTRPREPIGPWTDVAPNPVPGTEGQDRDNYTDTQDRKHYTLHDDEEH